MSLKLITAPTVLPISVADIKVDLKETGTARDTQIARLIASATERAEHELGRALLDQEWELIIDAFPVAEIELAMPKVLSITSVKYLDQAGAEQTLASNAYTLDADKLPGYLFPALNTSWPNTQAVANAVRVRFRCGYGVAAAAVPPSIIDWIVVQVATAYDNPDAVVFPTCVGMNRSGWCMEPHGLCVPHVRGDEPSAGGFNLRIVACSPRAWG